MKQLTVFDGMSPRWAMIAATWLILATKNSALAWLETFHHMQWPWALSRATSSSQNALSR